MGADVAVATSVCSTLYSPRFSHKAQLTSNVETCFDGATERTVVVKKVPKTWVLLPRMKKRMEAIRAIGPHENIVALYDALEQPTVMVFVYEHLTDGDLADHIPVNKGIGEEAAARVLVQIARGLSHMHTRGYVHRDIKPDNIGVERLPNGRLLVKIIDLEQATHVGESFLKAVGSIPYMAPELFSMRPASSIDLKACDAWSLGVVLYVLLCGRFPWQSARPTCPNFIRQTQGGCAVMEGLSAHIKEVLGGLLTVDCSKRWTVDMALRHMEAKWPDC